MEELKEQTRDVLEGRPAEPKIFPQQVRVVAEQYLFKGMFSF